jgi:hypothetical protein
MEVLDPDRSGGIPIPPPDIAGFPGLAGMVFTSPASGKDRQYNASMSAQDQAEWIHYDWFINMNTFLKGAFLLGILYFVGMGTSRKIRTIICVNQENQEYFRKPSAFWGAWKRYFFYAPVYSKNKYKKCLKLSKKMTEEPYRMRQTRLQAFAVIVYFGVNIAFSLIDIEWSKGKKEVMEDIRNRTGVLAIENLLPAFLFIMRSNPVMWMTGISRECNTFMHIWFSYTAVGLALVHSGLWMAGRIIYGSWSEMNVSAGKNYLWTAYMVCTSSLYHCNLLASILTDIRLSPH